MQLVAGYPFTSFAHPELSEVHPLDLVLSGFSFEAKASLLDLLIIPFLKNKATFSLIQTSISAGSFSVSWKSERKKKKKRVKFLALNGPRDPGEPRSL